MHRWVWDLHYTAPDSMRHDYPIAAIPHDTPRYPLGPNALPGTYTVRLTVDGKTSTAPLTVKMDPRVKTSTRGLQKKFETEAHLASIMSESTQALHQGGSIRSQFDKLNAQGNAQVKTSAADFEKKLNALMGTRGRILRAALARSFPQPAERTGFRPVSAGLARGCGTDHRTTASQRHASTMIART